MKIKAIKQGNTLQLLQKISLDDGQEVIIDISDMELNQSKSLIKWEDFQDVIGAWKDNEEITEIFASIAEERHQDTRREVQF